MICSPGDVVVVPFPFVDRPVLRRRPAVVLSNHAFNRDNGQTVVAMVTTARASSWPSDVTIENGSSAGLKYPSVVRWKVFTLPNDLIAAKAGRLGASDRRKVATATRDTFDLEAPR